MAVLSALARRGLLAPMSLEGAVNSEVCELYVEHCLAPALHRGDRVVLANVRFHYRARAGARLKAAGAPREYLPAYSPDFEPIEECISKLKALLRTLKARTPRKLGSALRYAIDQVTVDDIRGWFRH